MKKKLSIIVPVYNEVNTVLIILKKLKKLTLYDNFTSEIIIVDDKSTDGTVELLKKFKKKSSNVKLILKKKNMGKGHSQKIAKKYVTGKYVIIQDADLEYEPKDINKLLKIAVNNNKDFVIGHRNLKTAYLTDISHPYFIFRELAVNILTFLMNILYGTKIKDCACCYRLFNSKIWMNIKGKSDQFEYDFSIICQTILKTKNIGQCSVEYNARGYEDGKKCTWDVGIHAFKRIIFDKFNI